MRLARERRASVPVLGAAGTGTYRHLGQQNRADAEKTERPRGVLLTRLDLEGLIWDFEVANRTERAVESRLTPRNPRLAHKVPF
jgi:hypothetical protein